MSPAAPLAWPEVVWPGPAGLDRSPPGERYYRHPGDVVRVVLWGLATVALVLFVEVATGTSSGARADLARAATAVPRPARQLALGLVQVAALVTPVAVLVGLAVRRRWRRAALLVAAALAGAGALYLLDQLVDLPGAGLGRSEEASGVLSSGFPSLTYVAGASAAAMLGTPWLARVWRRATGVTLAVLVVVVVAAGIAGAPEALVAGTVGALVGSALLVVFGTPNRRPAPSVIAEALAEAGVPVVGLQLERAVGGLAQLYRATLAGGDRAFVKVYCQDSRDADLLYRGYRSLLLREAGGGARAPSLAAGVEHESFLLVLARRGGTRCPAFRAIAGLPDGSAAVAMDEIAGRSLATMTAADIDPGVLDALWREVELLHGAGIAHRALRAANVVVVGDAPVIVDLSFGEASASPRLRAIDRAELLASLAALVGPAESAASAARVLPPDRLAAAMPFLQPLALSAGTRKSVSKSALAELRAAVAEATGEEPLPLEQLIRVRPRTVVMIVTLTGAFYILLPQLANVDDSFEAAKSANWAWLLGAVVMSAFTYVFSALSTVSSVPVPLPFLPTVRAQLASSFVNRVTPANVGGMALNIRFMQKAGVEPAQAVTGVGLDVLAGGLGHLTLLTVFFAWAGQDGAGFSLPSSSTLLVVLVVLLVGLGVLAATRWGRKLIRTRVLNAVLQSLSSIASLARSPARLAGLFGGSVGVTLAYITALACAMAAFDADVSFAQVGAVYLGSSIIAAAAPTPGGLGALEAALVAGFSAIGVESGLAVAAVLSYRLTTYWLPILPGWRCFRTLQRDDFI